MAASKSNQQRKRADAFRRLLVRVSDRLGERDVRKIGFIYQVPSDNEDEKCGLDVLKALERQGVFSPTKTMPLVHLMKDINRHDIAEDVKADRAHRPVSRAASLPAQRSPKMSRRPRATTVSNGVKITLSSPDQDHSVLHAPPSKVDNHHLSVPQSAHDNMDYNGRAVHPEYAQPPVCEAFTKSEVLSHPSSGANQPDGDAREYQPKTNDSQSSEDDYDSLKRHNSWSEESRTLQITVNMSPLPATRSKSCERLRKKPARKALSFPHTEKKHPPLHTSLSVPGNIPSDFSSEEEAADSDSSDVLMMKPPPADEGEVKEPHSSPANGHTPEKDRNSHRDVSHWKILEGSQLRGRRGRRNSGKGLERTTQCTWCVKRESVLKSIWNHQHLNRTQCPTPVPIDIECGPQNPHVSLLLYHYGLFEDSNKSMTLQVKAVIPDDCPPLPTDATYTLTWEVRAVTKMGSMKLGSSKKPLKVRFDMGMFYIHKFLPHSLLQQDKSETLEICVCVTTAYSIRDDYTASTTADIPQKHADKMLLSFKTVLGNRKIAQEIGRAYHQFGCSLLDDEDGTITSSIAAKENYNAVAINIQIFSLWLQGQGRQPVQWLTLIHTLREIDMHDLASHMEHNLNS